MVPIFQFPKKKDSYFLNIMIYISQKAWYITINQCFVISWCCLLLPSSTPQALLIGWFSPKHSLFRWKSWENFFALTKNKFPPESAFSACKISHVRRKIPTSRNTNELREQKYTHDMYKQSGLSRKYKIGMSGENTQFCQARPFW